MKVKDITNKIKIIGTEVIIKESFKVVCTTKTPITKCEYLERAITTFQPVENKIEIFIKPLD